MSSLLLRNRTGQSREINVQFEFVQIIKSRAYNATLLADQNTPNNRVDTRNVLKKQ